MLAIETLRMHPILALEKRDLWVTTDYSPAQILPLHAKDLTRLPQLKHVHFRLPVSNSDEARVEEGFEALNALLLNRQGCLRLELHCS